MDRAHLEQIYSARLEQLKFVASRLEAKVQQDLAELSHIDRVYFRHKGVTSFLEKVLDRKIDPPYDNPLVDVEDQIAGRVLVFFRPDIDAVRTRLSDVFTPVESSRREPTREKEFDYESHHLVCLIPLEVRPNDWGNGSDFPKTFELQIRTLCMHAWAEPQHDVGYKSVEELARDDKRELAWIAASMWGADQAFERLIRRRGLSSISAEQDWRPIEGSVERV